MAAIVNPETLMHVGLCGHKLQQVPILPYEQVKLWFYKLPAAGVFRQKTAEKTSKILK